MSLVITGASGHLGRRTAELLLDRLDDPARLVLVTRRPDAVADLADRGAHVRAGDFDDPASLETAFAGAERVLIISTDRVGERLAGHRNAIAAAKAAGATHISYTSIPNPGPANPAGVVADHAATEEALRDSGVAWTALRNALYAEYRIPEAQAAIADGVLRHNQGTGRTAYVSREDCAAAAAVVLAGGAAHDGKAYDITGPELLGAEDLSALYAEIGGTPVQAIELSDDELAAGIAAAGLPEPIAELLASFGTAIRGGHLAQRSDDVQLLTGRPPRTVRETLATLDVTA